MAKLREEEKSNLSFLANTNFLEITRFFERYIYIFFWDLLRLLENFFGFKRIRKYWTFYFVLFFSSKLLRLLLKVIRVTTEHQKLPKIGHNSIKCPFLARRAKKP